MIDHSLGNTRRSLGDRVEFLDLLVFLVVVKIRQREELDTALGQLLRALGAHPNIGPQTKNTDPHFEWKQYDKNVRYTPLGKLEAALKDTGVLPAEHELPPHNLKNKPIPKPKPKPPTQKSGQNVAMPNNTNNNKKKQGRNRKRRAAKPKGGPIVVTTAPSGYPTMKERTQDNSMSFQAPTQRVSAQFTAPPKLRYSAHGVQVEHRELIAQVSGTPAFNAIPFALNPGLVGTFPWLSRIAANYESYTFQELIFCYETTASTAQTGMLMLAADYDAADSPPQDKYQASNYEGTVRASPWCPLYHVSTPRNMRKRAPYFVRAGGIAPNLDLQQYDTGNMFVITEGMANNNMIGDLYVKYKVRLETPRSLSSGGGNSIWGQYQVVDNLTAPSYVAGNLPATMALTANGAAFATTYTFTQPWQGEVMASATGTGIGAPAFTGTGIVAGTPSGNGNTTGFTVFAKVKALPLQTVIITAPNTTLTPSAAGGIFFTQGFGSYQ
jgi:hypothetical protein